MRELFRLLLSLSLSASLVMVLILAVDKLFKKRLSHAWHYYIWLIVIVRLLIPYAPETNLIDLIVQGSQQPVTTGAVIQPPQTENVTAILPQMETPMINADITPDETPMSQIDAKRYLWIVWAIVAVSMFVWKVFGYMRFVRFSARGRKRIESPVVLDIYQSAVRALKLCRAPILYKSRIAGLPMLIGLFRPYILIPDSRIDEQSLRHILLHELTHYKRCDALYKWLVQVVLCIHWFNPLVHLMAREVDKTCELSCDETVVSRLNSSERCDYGNMLLTSLQYSLQAPRRVMTLPLSKDGRLMKMRLNAIMNFKRVSISGLIISLLLSVCIMTGATFVGAYPKTELQQATGASFFQSMAIENMLAPHNIVYNKVIISTNAIITEGMDEDWEAYDLICRDGNTYVLLLRKADNDFTALLDSDGKLISGIIDNAVTPALYENGKYKYSARNHAVDNLPSQPDEPDSQSGLVINNKEEFVVHVTEDEQKRFASILNLTSIPEFSEKNEGYVEHDLSNNIMFVSIKKYTDEPDDSPDGFNVRYKVDCNNRTLSEIQYWTNPKYLGNVENEVTDQRLIEIAIELKERLYSVSEASAQPQAQYTVAYPGELEDNPQENSQSITMIDFDNLHRITYDNGGERFALMLLPGKNQSDFKLSEATSQQIISDYAKNRGIQLPDDFAAYIQIEKMTDEKTINSIKADYIQS